MRVAVYGAGGHGREVLEVLRSMQRAGDDLEIAGFLDDEAALHGADVSGIPVLGDASWLGRNLSSDIQIAIAVGNSRAVKKLADHIEGLGCTLATLISPQAYVSSDATIGRGAVVFPGAVVQPDVRVGECVLLNVSASVSHDSKVGPCAIINPGARLAGNVTVGEGAFIGMGANVIQGTSVGAWATVGAGAVVIDDIPDHATAVGVPARVIKCR